MVQLNFDATQVAPEMGFETVPAGWYNAMIDQSEMKPTKDGSGAYLEARFNIIDGQYANRKIFMRLNLRNTNPVAQEIAYKQLSAIAHAVGVLHVQDSSQLHGLPMKIKVKLRKDTTGQYEDSNEISTIKNINEQVDMGAQAPAAPGGFGGGAAPGGMPPGFGAPQQAPTQQQWQQMQNFGQAPQQAPAPQQQPAQQPWQQPAPQQAAPQPQQAPAQQQPAPQQWQQPAAQQPWQQAPAQQAPVQQQEPAQQQQPHPAQSATPPWAQPAQ